MRKNKKYFKNNVKSVANTLKTVYYNSNKRNGYKKMEEEKMTDEKLYELLKKETNMTENDIKKHIDDGISVYENNNVGYEDFKEEALANLNDEEDIPEMWEKMDIIGDYRMDFEL